jgi:hypothetical protein
VFVKAVYSLTEAVNLVGVKASLAAVMRFASLATINRSSMNARWASALPTSNSLKLIGKKSFAYHRDAVSVGRAFQVADSSVGESGALA